MHQKGYSPRIIDVLGSYSLVSKYPDSDSAECNMLCVFTSLQTVLSLVSLKPNDYLSNI
jgi:hypothetical protein